PSPPSKVIRALASGEEVPSVEDVLKRLRRVDTPLSPESDGDGFYARWNAALGCRTNEVALMVLGQIVQLEHPNLTALSDAQLDTSLRIATAAVAELEPSTPAEALLAAQMVGASKASMNFLARALAPEQQVEVAERNVYRAVRLMRLFNEQLEAM